MGDLQIAQNTASHSSQRIHLSFAAKTKLKAITKILDTLLTLEITGQKCCFLKQLNGWLRNKIIRGKHFAISWKVEVDGKTNGTKSVC